MIVPPHELQPRAVAAVGLVVVVLLVLLALIAPRWTATADDVSITVAPDPTSGVGGGSDGSLRPGVVRHLNLSFHNPSRRAIVVTDLSVTVREVRAPHATAQRPCTVEDYRATSGQIGRVGLPADDAVSLAEAGVPRRGWPTVEMLNTDSNQDGCKGAEVVLDYQTVLEDL